MSFQKLDGWINDQILTLATVSDVEATGEHVAGLVAELVGQPGVGTALIAVGRPAETTSKLPDVSAWASTSPGHVATASSSTWWTEKKITFLETGDSDFRWAR